MCGRFDTKIFKQNTFLVFMSESLENQLKGFISRQLQDLAWYTSYPINFNKGLECLFDTLFEGGFVTKFDESKRTATFSLPWMVKGKHSILDTTLGYDALLRGWKNSPYGSLRSLEESMYLVHDSMAESVEQWREDCAGFTLARPPEEWRDFRNNNPRRLRDLMEKKLNRLFELYQENMFVNFDGSLPTLKHGKIFEEVMQNYPLETLRNAIFLPYAEERTVSPTVDALVEDGVDFGFSTSLTDEEEKQGGVPYHPSESTLLEYLFGCYLVKLVDVRGWPLEEKGDGLFRLLATRGEKGLPLGYTLNWAHK